MMSPIPSPGSRSSSASWTAEGMSERGWSPAFRDAAPRRATALATTPPTAKAAKTRVPTTTSPIERETMCLMKGLVAPGDYFRCDARIMRDYYRREERRRRGPREGRNVGPGARPCPPESAHRDEAIHGGQCSDGRTADSFWPRERNADRKRDKPVAACLQGGGARRHDPA